MSGLYLIVWDDQPGVFLRPTKGGWPHITMGYSGNNLSKDVLVKHAQDLFKFVLQKVSLDNIPLQLVPEKLETMFLQKFL